MIEERESYLYIQTNYSIYVIQDDRVVNHIDIGKGELCSFATWGFITKSGYIVSLYTRDGSLIGNINFSKEPCEIVPVQSGTIIYTQKERIKFTIS